MVDRAGNELLARASLSSDQNRDVDARSLLDDRPHVAHLGAAPERELLLEANAGIVVPRPVPGGWPRAGERDLGDRGLKAREAPRGEHDLLCTQQVGLPGLSRIVTMSQHDERPRILVA